MFTLVFSKVFNGIKQLRTLFSQFILAVLVYRLFRGNLMRWHTEQQ